MLTTLCSIASSFVKSFANGDSQTGMIKEIQQIFQREGIKSNADKEMV